MLRTNTDLPAEEVALKYKQLWMVESLLFRTLKSILEPRPIYHRRDETILGHVFCSFLPFVLMKELQSRAARLGYALGWADVIRDLDKLQETELEQDGKRFLLRTEASGTCGEGLSGSRGRPASNSSSGRLRPQGLHQTSIPTNPHHGATANV